MDEKRAPPPPYYDPSSHDNHGYATEYSTNNYPPQSDSYSTQYQPSPSTDHNNHTNNAEPIITDPYANNFGPKVPPIVNPYGYEVGPNSRQNGYGQYANSGQMVMVTQPNQSEAVPDHFCLALIVTLFFCWPLGLFAITKNSEAKSRVAEGNYPAAREAAASSKKLSLIGIGAGIVIISMAVGIGVWAYRRNYYYYYY